jgi:2-polyprenyl-6-methoxyphenol hydroxylase-like FAD-dependent oxidoreductase
MPNPILKQAVVIGAGMGGLAAAKAVAPHFEKVIVFERDSLPDEPAPRAGTPQARHTHGLLAGGHRALDRLFPGIELDLVEAGAVRMRMRRDTRSIATGFDDPIASRKPSVGDARPEASTTRSAATMAGYSQQTPSSMRWGSRTISARILRGSPIMRPLEPR